MTVLGEWKDGVIQVYSIDVCISVLRLMFHRKSSIHNSCMAHTFALWSPSQFFFASSKLSAFEPSTNCPMPKVARPIKYIACIQGIRQIGQHVEHFHIPLINILHFACVTYNQFQWIHTCRYVWKWGLTWSAFTFFAVQFIHRFMPSYLPSRCICSKGSIVQYLCAHCSGRLTWIQLTDRF